MNPVWIIEKKRDGGELSHGELAFFVAKYANGAIPDEQMAALAMAIYLNGMTAEETTSLTSEMLASGERFIWPEDGVLRVDKHSTGGIGDKVSIALAPMLACCGMQVPMISGRGLGSTGGTLDKLESIGGFQTNLSMEEMRQVVAKVGCVISGATPELVPADRKLYALRDVTGTVPSIPLITASIMSKKLAEGLDALVLDVKFGSGAFMKSIDDARKLAVSLVETGKQMSVPTTALLTDMNQPLGRMIGNAVEVDEAVELLAGSGPGDLLEVTLAVGAELLLSAGIESEVSVATGRLQQTIFSGAAREKLAEMVTAQGGNLEVRRQTAPPNDLGGERSGYVVRIDTEQLGHAIITLGGGRKRQGEVIDHTTGLEMLVRLGDKVDAEQPLVRVFAKAANVEKVREALLEAIEIGEESVEAMPVIADKVT